MSIEALYSVEFGDAQAINGGVVVLETGRIFGGDSQYYYIGEYEASNGRIQGTVSVNHYSGPPATIFGTAETQFSITIEGVISNEGQVIQCVGTKSGQRIGIIMRKRAELP